MKIITFLLTLFVTTLSSYADTEAQRTNHYNHKKGIAIKGYDPVAYFSGEAKKGDSKFKHTTKGITYHFSSASNLAKFKKKPTSYEPQYGGWCAYAFAKDQGKVSINPKSYKVVNGKLYLFYNAIGGNTLKSWNKSADAPQISAADKVWKKTIQ